MSPASTSKKALTKKVLKKNALKTSQESLSEANKRAAATRKKNPPTPKQRIAKNSSATTPKRDDTPARHAQKASRAPKQVPPKKATNSSRMSASEIQAAFERWRELNPHPTTELEYSSAFELLVAVVLSAQATDVGVNKATRRLFPVANTPRAIAALGVETLKTYISTIGLFNTKAANVIALCEQLIANHGGEVPRDRAALEALPGVGRKTANVVLNTAFGEPTMAVDTHIFRVANRTGLAPGKDVLAVENALLQRVPSAFLQDAHHWLILHGRYTCIARKPACGRCPIRDLCKFKDKTEGSQT
jgi:endonuclease III